MEYTLCNKCETAIPSYLVLCQKCNSDLFESEGDSANNIGEEHEEIFSKSLAIKALIASVFTTAFKVWFLYGLTSEAHQSFLQPSVLSAIFLPIIGAILAFIKNKKWYWVLILDSLLMTLIFVAGLFLFTYVMLNK
jgi:hypothetical protein